MIPHVRLTTERPYPHLVAHDRALQRRVLDRRVRTDDRIADLRVPQCAAGLDGDVRADLDVLEVYALGDAHGFVDAHVGTALRIQRATAVFEEMAVGLEDGVDLAGVVPAFDWL